VPASLISVQGPRFSAARPDTLSLDNGGDSGRAYWANNSPSAQQLPGPFTPTVSIGLPPRADSLDFVPELLALFVAFLDKATNSIPRNRSCVKCAIHSGCPSFSCVLGRAGAAAH